MIRVSEGSEMHVTREPLGHKDELPAEIYISLVKSLYVDPKTLIVGSTGTIAAALITAAKTWQIEFLACAIGMLLISFLRALDMHLFRARDSADLDLKTARRWEIRYVFGASSYVLLMGIWCFLAFAITTDSGVQLLCFSMTLVNMIGAAGRNFGSRMLVSAQLIAAGTPMLLGLFWIGSLYYAIVACVLAPFFISFKTIADRLRTMLTGAVVATHDARMLADQLDAALNNMAHGLCMIDKHGKVILANRRLPEILGIPAFPEPGRSLSDLLRSCLRAGVLSVSEFRHALRETEARLTPSNELPLTMSLRDGRTLSLKLRMMNDGNSVVVVEDISEQINTETKIRSMAFYDSLTKLPNRALFSRTLNDIVSKVTAQKPCAIMFMDVDHFKQVNDTLGHRYGDELLIGVSERLQAACGDQHLIARLGGDEFVIIVSPATREKAAQLAERVIKSLTAPFEVNGHQINVGMSAGISMAPVDSWDPDQLLRYADLALYKAKADGRGTFRFFEASMGVDVENQLALENDLRKALEGGELEVHFQPILSMKDGGISGFEALLRWNHPTRGWVSPAEFIPLAESVGLIEEIGSWALRQACTEAARWPDDIYLAVNLSPQQFRNKTLVLNVLSVLGQTGFPASRLELEITEALLLQNSEANLAILGQLRGLGVRISMDDFGTGYSSLSYLQKFPFDKIKIDQSFIRDLPDGQHSIAIVNAAIGLGVHLGLTVTAEGVETEEQNRALQLAGCLEAQGYLYARPQPAKNLPRLLTAIPPIRAASFTPEARLRRKPRQIN